MTDNPDLDLSPLVFTVTVDQPIGDAFTLFTDKIGTWWPKASHSIGEERVVDVVLEPWRDGRLYERQNDGTECSWGEVLVWDAPHRFVMTWHPSLQPIAVTEVEVRFAVVDPATTAVELTHRHWQRLGDVAAVAHDAATQPAGSWCSTDTPPPQRPEA